MSYITSKTIIPELSKPLSYVTSERILSNHMKNMLTKPANQSFSDLQKQSGALIEEG